VSMDVPTWWRGRGRADARATARPSKDGGCECNRPMT